MKCPYCDETMEYVGVDDDGFSVGEIWRCDYCDHEEFNEVYEIEFEEDDE